MKSLTFTVAAGCLSASMALADTPVLTVYAPDYFVSEWGPGPKIEELFEARCACDLQFKPGDLLPRILLEGARTEADVVIGLNTDVTKKARESGLFAEHGVDFSALTLPIEWTDEVFVPFNYGHTAFVYDTTRVDTAPQSFEALLNAPDDLRLVIQDPRSSISGLALVLWVQAVYGDKAEEAWTKLAPKILTVTKGWSESYGLFTDGEADMVLSYTTSPAYHIIAEGDETKKAAIFPEGHYFMVELAAKLAGTDQPELADQFMQFILSEDFQGMIATGNWSFPAALPEDQWPAGFQQLDMPEKVLFYSEDEAAALRGEAIEAWRRALSQ
ncbi:thiamine ABC transporter substrate binding subunit [Mameliella sediminis]|uniref:thiamine ABC transporter substrate binding subunit n=1 Tax=Mameliella sediminis TaxID=2836866 RepID=UPI001C43AB11|nr:thiamine ABC transporter substrate binding subunit [Mameliella sediminis]MBY6113526.1 thiamine ABC transporter substrate binding subunit [Antarctobacter heliothermus]MBY6143126.1 thiamine ABC transporter substrate binding subunit [Mameliella alba]MBV7394824.1 thiamine ABC transporter substrate binding subunit [Mameliella sediminis]MBY6159981.1 thiamine ABC transporter substrate binding subunit [Mameliella alba]MBY6168452.1 thiamine ABC transporter substrate binding subunit [Mameliella alba]